MSREKLPGVCGGYKGIENFLRRVAFNLGNTPSETEVKIISCIPIDVTDLQQKIADLEKQLEAAEAPNSAPCTTKPSVTKKASSNKKQIGTNMTPSKQTSRALVANQVLCERTLPINNNSDYLDNEAAGKPSNVSLHFDCSPGQTKKSIISFLYPTGREQNYNIVAEVSNLSKEKEKLKEPKKSLFNKKKCRATKKKTGKTQLVYYAKPDNKSPFNNFVPADHATSENAHREELEDCNDDDVAYFSHIINKQYMPRPVLNDISNTSEFSSPVCRDEDDMACRATVPYESDVCSCCRGPFHNLDRHMSPAHRFDLCHNFTDKENDKKYAYYDSSAYDVIPVKEKNYKSAEDFDVLSRRDFRRHIDMKCWPERVRPKKVQPADLAFVREGRRKQRVIVNYHALAPIRHNLYMKTNKRNIKKDIILNKMAAKRPIMTHSLNLNRNSQDFKICDVDFGEVHVKRNTKNMIPKPVKLHNVSCSATILNNSECQTGMETSRSLIEDKTTATLNQIKAILQSVLTEVKTKGKSTSLPEPKKDAVVQNGLSQSNIWGGSHLMNSITYSHYNTNPYIASCSRQMPSSNYCPPNMPYGGTKCIQHYPLFVQPNRHRLCSTCCGNGHVTKQPPAAVVPVASPTHAISTATNTDRKREQSQETQKLIQDIYNSIALNLGMPTENTALNQGDQNTNSKAYVVKTDTEKEINKKVNVISEIFKNPNPLNTSVTEKTTPLSKLTSNDTTLRSGSYGNNKRASPTNKRSTVDDTTTVGDTETDAMRVYKETDSDQQSDGDDTAVNEDVDPCAGTITTASDSSSTDDDEDDEQQVPAAAQQSSKKQERKGILSKMLKLFTPRNRRRSKKSIKEQTESETDSDDYRTVYSQKVSARPTPKRDVQRVEERSKVHNYPPTEVITSKRQRVKQRSPERYRRAPYMEQEYRRYWDEKLLFQDRNAKYSTEASRMSTPVYRQNYEVRRALVESDPRVPCVVSVTHRNPPRRSSYATNRTTATGNHPRGASTGLDWLKKHKLGIQCGDQWKKLILEG